jgi:2-polyprenyl-6-methoxyphenol hydroxylase-like FAD-dependent oxidoreductase
MEIMSQLGLADSFLAQGIQVRAANAISGGRKLARISFEQLDSPFPFVLSLEQNKTEQILRDYAASFGVRVENRELLSLAQEEKRFSWVIGCDGAHSMVRKQLQLPFEGRPLRDVFSLADVRVHWDRPHGEVFAFLNTWGIVAAIPLPEKDRYRLVFQLPRCRNLVHDSLAHGQIDPSIAPNPTVEEIEALLQRSAGPSVRVSDPIWMANFQINSRMTQSFRKGRVFLAGDAAHIHSPVGAQGMNTGLQDAFNLAWKLAYVHQGWAKESLLDTYDLERRAVGKTLLKATERASQMVAMHNPLAVALRNAIFSGLTRIPAVRHAIARAISQTTFHYPASAISNGEGRVIDPHLLRTKKFHLFLYNAPKQEGLSKHIEQVEVRGEKQASACLVRPDGYIAYRKRMPCKRLFLDVLVE